MTKPDCLFLFGCDVYVKIYWFIDTFIKGLDHFCYDGLTDQWLKYVTHDQKIIGSTADHDNTT